MSFANVAAPMSYSEAQERMIFYSQAIRAIADATGVLMIFPYCAQYPRRATIHSCTHYLMLVVVGNFTIVGKRFLKAIELTCVRSPKPPPPPPISHHGGPLWHKKKRKTMKICRKQRKIYIIPLNCHFCWIFLFSGGGRVCDVRSPKPPPPNSHM